MKKVVFQCAGNVLLFAFLGLAFIYPFTEIVQTELGFGGRLSVFPLLLLAYLIAYPIVYFVAAKRNGWKKGVDSELTYADEREKAIVAESTKIAYKALVGGLLCIVPALGGVRFFSLFTGIEISIYTVSVTLLTALLIVSTVLYCAKWCRDYRK